ncbi:hypothetical protein DM02DRAFT_260238 [Periconia macrospinosa]|uniref:Uncharacterized protein n=1 Tax=Periconia macrospinosa TaxID=97972 RepID=A0A2V1D4E6_9PLEO|nr:hypothetical protein DM02DRAFT_260238 [Periconia macrospinosa]
MENTQILVILKDRFPKATWAQIATAFNACRQSGHSRTRDGVQKRYSRIDLVAVKSTISPSLERMVLQKASHVLPIRFYADKARATSPLFGDDTASEPSIQPEPVSISPYMANSFPFVHLPTPPFFAVADTLPPEFNYPAPVPWPSSVFNPDEAPVPSALPLESTICTSSDAWDGTVDAFSYQVLPTWNDGI